MDGTMTPADIQAVMGGNEGNCGSWWIILLFICLFGGNGLWGGNATAATANDIQRAVDLNSIQEGQATTDTNVQRIGYELGGIVKDASYNNLSEIRDLDAGIANGFTNMQTGFCGTQRAIDSVKYENAINTASINSNIDAKFAALEKGQLEQQIATQAAQIQQLQLNAAMCGVIRYPNATTYTAGAGFFPPYYGMGTTF